VSELRDLADEFSRFGATINRSMPVEETLRRVTAAARTGIRGAEAAAVTRGRHGDFETVGATHELALRVDAIQYELEEGPCVEAVIANTFFKCNELLGDDRWPHFAARAVAETGVRSMLSFRLYFEADSVRAALNVYSTEPGAFDDVAEATGLVLSTHAALALTGALRMQKIVNLERALASNRDIGVAMGILMARHLVTKEQAFDLLRISSQHTHRKLGEIALDVIDCGRLELPAGDHGEPKQSRELRVGMNPTRNGRSHA
jgi:hypothetical protein